LLKSHDGAGERSRGVGISGFHGALRFYRQFEDLGQIDGCFGLMDLGFDPERGSKG
jgi:hypothetical protein